MGKKDAYVERLGDVLGKSLKRLELAPRLDEYGVWPVWNEVVGNPIARNAQPEKIRNGTLFVKVASSVWMQQLQFMKELITEKLNQRLGTVVVKNIFFVVGKIDMDAAETEAQPAARSAPEPPELDETFLNSVTDPDIRQAFKRLLRSYARRKLQK
jgi:predicted nucleic acid-binding Zn ribbon protein